MSGLAVRGAFENVILPAFEAETGIRAIPEWIPTTLIMSKIAAGACPDIVVLIAGSMDRLAEQNHVDPATRVELCHSRLGLAVPPGAPHPDISSVESFVKALLDARSVAYSIGGASGIYFRKLTEKLGIAYAIGAKATAIPAGFTAEKLMTGEADLAVQQVSELMVVPGAEIIGRFPEELQEVTSFSAAIMRGSARREAAERLIASLTGDRAAEAYRANGVDPA
jgi:molybdate transport system substrate-binding protein